MRGLSTFLDLSFLYLSVYFVKSILILIYLLKDRHSAFTDSKFVFVVTIPLIYNE